MVLLTFTDESAEKILAGRKCATTRPLTPHWRRVVDAVARGQSVRLQIYRKSPRNGGKRLFDEDVEPRRADAVHGADYDGEMFLKDGFDSSTDLVLRLREFYGPRFCAECQRYELGAHFAHMRNNGSPHHKGPELPEEEAAHWFDTSRWAFIEFPTPVDVRLVAARELEQASA